MELQPADSRSSQISPFSSAPIEEGEGAAEEEEQQQEGPAEEPEPPTGERAAGLQPAAQPGAWLAVLAPAVAGGGRAAAGLRASVMQWAWHASQDVHGIARLHGQVAWPATPPSCVGAAPRLLALLPCRPAAGYEDDTSGRKRYGRAFLFYYGNKCTGARRRRCPLARPPSLRCWLVPPCCWQCALSLRRGTRE